MLVRPIASHEVQSFVELNTDPSHTHAIRQYLDQMLAKDSARIEWCFVIENAGQRFGRVAFWKLPKTDKPSDIILLDLEWEREDYLSIGQSLLQEVISIAHRLGSGRIGYVLDTPPIAPQWHYCSEQRAQLLETVGFKLERETYRFELNTANHPVAFPTGLIFKSLSEVGEDAFIDALARVSAQSLDQRTRQDREMMGAEAEARMTFEDLAQMEYDPAWWQLAYAPDGALVGLVMPTKSPTFATIGYIGVVPEQRGHGYIHLLLQQGMATLNAAGEHFLRTDTDVSNTPMANAFRRAGYTQFATRREYSVKL